jgi:hypothetical protein
MYYYRLAGQLVCSPKLLPDMPAPGRPPDDADSAVVLFERSPQSSRASFAVRHPRQIFARREDVGWLDPNRIDAPDLLIDPLLLRLILAGRLRAVNLSHPRWRDLLTFVPSKGKCRVNLLALGDVGGMLLTGLRLLGGGIVGSIGICDLSQSLSARWEYEVNQIATADGEPLPEAEIIPLQRLFECDAFVFVASAGVPPVGLQSGDVRMAQFEANSAIVAHYARLARLARFDGLFAVVSDPVDPLAKTAFVESNLDASGRFDGGGLLPEQVQGFGLGVMQARAAYFARRDARFARYLTEGRVFGPHGEDLVVADSIAHYDDALSRELTRLTVTANLRIRALGFKPYVAPAFSSGALSLIPALGGGWHPSSTFLGGVFMGAKNRFTPAGLEVEMLPLPDALFSRIEQAAHNLLAIV